MASSEAGGLARREALERYREEAHPQQGAEGAGRAEPGEAQAKLPVRVGADRLVGERVHAHDAPVAPRGVEADEEGPGAARRLRIEIGEPEQRLEPARRLGVAARARESRAGREPGGDVVGMLARAAEGFVEIRRRARRRPGERGELGVERGAPRIGSEGPLQLLARLRRAPLPPGHSRETEPCSHRARLVPEGPAEVILRAREVALREGGAAETDARRRRGGICLERAREAILGGREVARLERLLAETDQRGGELRSRGVQGDGRSGRARERDPRREACREERAPAGGGESGGFLGCHRIGVKARRPRCKVSSACAGRRRGRGASGESVVRGGAVGLALFLLLEWTARLVIFGPAGLDPRRVGILRDLDPAELVRFETEPELVYEYKPDLDLFFKGVHFRTNSRGMRDREYALEKPPARSGWR